MLKKIFLALVILIGISAISFNVEAGSNDNVRDWLWAGSDTNFGWISTNNITGGGNVNYGLNIPANDGNVTGYAWSENLGWINFEPEGPYPAAPNYSVKRVGNKLEGWARIVSIQTASSIGNSGGWLGWIKMSGTVQVGGYYGVTITPSSGQLKGYAWSDELGWIDFSRAQTNPTVTHHLNICNICSSGNPLPALTMNINDTRNLRACLADSASSCSGTDVTASASWNDTNSPQDAVSIPSKGTVQANKAGSENVNVSYNDNGNSLSNSLLVNVSDNRNLVVCENSCTGGTLVNTLQMKKGNTQNLKACLVTNSNSCSGIDVTTSASWNDTNNPQDAVTIPFKGTVQANKAGSENVNVSYNGKNTSFTVNVTGGVDDWREVTP